MAFFGRTWRSRAGTSTTAAPNSRTSRSLAESFGRPLRKRLPKRLTGGWLLAAAAAGAAAFGAPLSTSAATAGGVGDLSEPLFEDWEVWATGWSANLGWTVAIDGDVLASGTPFANAPSMLSGKAYVFERDAEGSWTQRGELVASDGAAFDFFGSSVAVSGSRIVVGAYHYCRPGSCQDPGPGAAYVFERNDLGSWGETAKLVASDGVDGDGFGVSVAVGGDTILVGAYLEGADQDWPRGATYVYQRDGTGEWVESAILATSHGGETFCGTRVALDRATAAIGCWADSNQGAAYVFDLGESGLWRESARITASDATDEAAFGRSVALDGDTLVVGSEDSTLAPFAGAAYVFERDGAGVWTEKAKLTPPDPEPYDYFAYDVAADTGVVVIGAYGDDHVALNAGTAFLARTNANGAWELTDAFQASEGASSDSLGFSVAVSRDTVAAGAPYDASNEWGSIYLYSRPDTIFWDGFESGDLSRWTSASP